MKVNSSPVLLLLVICLEVTVTLSCLTRRQEPAGYRQSNKRPIMDLVDERDDGQTLTLGDSEKMIVPPEEDEDPTDDQAPDIDKKEDLEDLGSVQVVHLDNEVYELDIPINMLPQYKIFNQSSDHSSVILVANSQLKTSTPHLRKDSHQTHGKANSVRKTQRTTSKRPSEDFPPGRGQLKSGVTRQSIPKDGKGIEWEAANQAIIVLVVVLAFLLCLMIVICIVLLIKIRLLNKTCKASKTSLLDKEMSLMV